MIDHVPNGDSRKHWDLILRVARRPGFCCCCICTPSEDRKRARRIFRLTRAVTKSWQQEMRERAKAEAEGSTSSP